MQPTAFFFRNPHSLGKVCPFKHILPSSQKQTSKRTKQRGNELEGEGGVCILTDIRHLASGLGHCTQPSVNLPSGKIGHWKQGCNIILLL